MNRWSDPEVAAEILKTYKTWAVVGCSDDPSRPSYGVATYLQDQGYEVICVNPNHDACIDGAPCFPDLASIDRPVDVVDIFRRSEAAGTHVDEAIEVGAKAVWMQLGVVDEAAAERAAGAGLKIVMDRCPRIDLPLLRRA